LIVAGLSLACFLAVLISVPGDIFSGDGKVRSRVSRVRSDMRALSIALDSYRTDNRAFPPGDSLRFQATEMKVAVPESGGNLLTVPTVLTRPIQYVSTYYTDAFQPPKSWGLSYAYYPDAEGWLLFSVGPDGDYDITDPARVYDSDTTQPSLLLVTGPWTYDPTNGAVSSGDVWRVKQ